MSRVWVAPPGVEYGEVLVMGGGALCMSNQHLGPPVIVVLGVYSIEDFCRVHPF